MTDSSARSTARLSVAVVVMAAAATLGSLSLALGVVSGPVADRFVAGAGADVRWSELLLGVVAVAVAQLAQLRVRVGSGAARLAWGEAAIVIVCAMLPVPFVTPVMLVGVGLSRIVLCVVDGRRSLVTLVYGVSALTIAGALSATTVAIAGPVGPPHTPRAIGVLVGAAIAYMLAGSLLVAARVSLVHGDALGPTLFNIISSKLAMVVGNIAIGLLVVWAISVDALLLILLLPLLWLLHQFYANRLRADDDRRTWHEFSEATRELNRLDEREAASAGIAGALRLFGAASARVVVDDPQLGARTFGEGVDHHDDIVRVLTVGPERIGELRLSGVRPLRARDRMMLAAYGDALAGALHDAITHHALRTMGERTTYDAVHDPLTGLFNRAALLSRGNNALRLLAADCPIALLILDIDDFKDVNNALGHTAGDEALQVFARRVADCGNAGDLLARLGGDEFALLVTDLSAAGGSDLALAVAVERARKLGERLAVPMEVGGVALSKEASVGVVVAVAGEVDMTELLRRADIAMYQAKRDGQPVAWYEPGRDDASTDRLALLAELRETLNGGDQLTLDLQPAVALDRGAPAGGQVTGVEALVRWQHPRRGRLAPEQFLPVVESSELIGALTRHILDRAIALAAGWRRAGLAVPISVNVSARSLGDRRLPDTIAEQLARHRLPAELLVLEITETVVLSKSPVVDEVLGRIRALGVQLAVDDFGTGYSSFTFLTRVQVDEVKIDREFVAQMFDSAEAAAIVRSTISLARELSLRVVAEGVETAEQRAALVDLGCTSAQGYHFYPPLAAERVTAVLRERRQAQRRHLRAQGAG